MAENTNPTGAAPMSERGEGVAIAPPKQGGMTRREVLKLGGIGVAAAATGLGCSAAQGERPLKGKRIAMVIDLHRCTGCGGCMITCKNENNVQDGFQWSSNIHTTSGKFPNVRYEYVPTLCNHCEKAPCVRICPTGAMHKADGNVTAHDPDVCIGCKSCVAACPYGVISVNAREPHAEWRNDEALVPGCTESAKETARKAGGRVIPYYNPAREAHRKGSGLRTKGIVEKCSLCDHRLARGELPYCVDRCPAKARVIGDLNDPESAVSKLLGKFRHTRLKEHLGTEPKVFYIRTYNMSRVEPTKGAI